MLGRDFERLQIRVTDAEKMVSHSRESKGLTKGRDEKNKQTASRYAEIRDKVQTVFDSNLKNTLNYAVKLVAKELGVSFETARRTASRMKPRNKIKK